jgi:hypothetical protein
MVPIASTAPIMANVPMGTNINPYSGPFGLGQTMIPQYMMPQTAAYQITDANQASSLSGLNQNNLIAPFQPSYIAQPANQNLEFKGDVKKDPEEYVQDFAFDLQRKARGAQLSNPQSLYMFK